MCWILIVELICLHTQQQQYGFTVYFLIIYSGSWNLIFNNLILVEDQLFFYFSVNDGIGKTKTIIKKTLYMSDELRN